MRTGSGRLRTTLVTEPEVPGLAGGREAHRATQAATLEFIAHAMLFSAHGRGCPLPRPPCHPCSNNTMVGMTAIRGVSSDR